MPEPARTRLLRGGTGVPESVATHSLVFATFTAPSLGPVHTSGSRTERDFAVDRAAVARCAHGRSLACSRWHADDDPCLGDAICPECFDYERASTRSCSPTRSPRRCPRSASRPRPPAPAPYAWGPQHDVRALDLGTAHGEAARVAGYIAKYATKSTEDAGGVRYRIEKEHELRNLRCRDHAKRLISSAWRAGDHVDIDEKRFTKSRRFSTTFKALREARPTRRPPSRKVHNVVRVTAWSYVGSGYPRAGDALLAASTHARARDRRRAAREAA